MRQKILRSWKADGQIITDLAGNLRAAGGSSGPSTAEYQKD